MRALATLLLLGALAGCASRPVDAPAPAPQPPQPRPAQPAPVPPASIVVPPAPAGATGQAALVSHYDCGEAAFTLRLDGDLAMLEGLPRGPERLGRDAGGVTPQQMVFSSATLRAEFGLGADSRDALLQYLQPPQVLHCRRG